MLRTIILALFGFVVLALVFVWVISGGPKKIYNSVRNFSLASSTPSDGFRLPWQPANLFPYIELQGAIDEYEQSSSAQEAELAAIREEYQELSRDVDDAMTFGNPSPFFRAVRIAPGGSRPDSATPRDEYIELQASFQNTGPVSLKGWSLQSAVSGNRMYLPDAAPRFAVGKLNAMSPVTLNPGASASVISGTSPLGVSFRENICSGYLGQFQEFTPSLSLQCPSGESEMPLTAENIKNYGDACFDFVRTLPTCAFPQETPSSLSPACRSFVQSTFSYNGCTARHGYDSLPQDMWRLYLGSGSELWRDRHDAIRLLDAQGQTVDVYVY